MTEIGSVKTYQESLRKCILRVRWETRCRKCLITYEDRGNCGICSPISIRKEIDHATQVAGNQSPS